jgi:hypothetical protein
MAEGLRRARDGDLAGKVLTEYRERRDLRSRADPATSSALPSDECTANRET